MASRTAKGMMIVISPTQAQMVLTFFLDLRRAVPLLPVGAFLGKSDITSKLAPDQANDPVEQRMSLSKSLRIIIEYARPSFPKSLSFTPRIGFAGHCLSKTVTAVTASFDGFEVCVVFDRDQNAAIPCERFAVWFGGEFIGANE